MVQIMAAIKKSTKTANIESPPFYCQRLFILERNLYRLAEIVKLDFRKESSETGVKDNTYKSRSGTLLGARRLRVEIEYPN